MHIKESKCILFNYYFFLKMFFKCDIDNVFIHWFQPTYGCFNIISDIIRAKFDEPTPSWLKVSVDLYDRWFREFKVI